MCLSYPRNKRSRVPETGPEPMCAAPRSAIYKKVRARNKGTKTDLQSGATSGKRPPKEMCPNRRQKPVSPPDPHNHSAFLTMGVKME